MTTIVLSKEDCYLSLPDFYEVLADKVSKCNGGSRPTTIDCRKIRITKSVYDEIKRCLKEIYNMTPLEITILLIIYGPKPDYLNEKTHLIWLLGRSDWYGIL